MKKIFKITGIILFVFILLILILALIAPKQYSVDRTVVISRPKQEVYNYVKFLKNQNQFSVWAKLDPNMKTDFKGIDGTAGFISSWDSQVKEAGKGEQEIIKIEDGVRIDYEIRFMKPIKSINYAFISFEAVNDSATNVKWGFYGKVNYPMNIIMLFMKMDKMVGKDLEGGLNNLKNILESKEKILVKVNPTVPSGISPGELESVLKSYSLIFFWKDKKLC